MFFFFTIKNGNGSWPMRKANHTGEKHLRQEALFDEKSGIPALENRFPTHGSTHPQNPACGQSNPTRPEKDFWKIFISPVAKSRKSAKL